MKAISTIEQLIESFDDADPSKRASVLKKIEIPTEEFEEYATWTEGGYTRNCIGRTDDFELILLCWDVDAGTPIHGHGGQDCWVYQVAGTVKEKRYTESISGGLKVTNELSLKAGKLAYMHDRMGYHTIENISGQRAMTLHVYANPIDRCKVYNDKTQRFEIREMEYDTIDGMEITKTAS